MGPIQGARMYLPQSRVPGTRPRQASFGPRDPGQGTWARVPGRGFRVSGRWSREPDPRSRTAQSRIPPHALRGPLGGSLVLDRSLRKLASDDCFPPGRKRFRPACLMTSDITASLMREKFLIRYTLSGIFISPWLTRTELPLTRIPVITLSERSASTSRRLGRPISTP